MSTFAITSSVNVASSGECMYVLKTLLSSSGWVVVSSSNGTTFQAGDLITSGAVLANNNAWFVIKQPPGALNSYGGTQREFGFQRTTNTQEWIITYSYVSGHKTGGSTTTLPSASDMQYILSGAPGNSTFQLFPTDGNGYKYFAACDTVSPYGVWGAAVPFGGGNPTHAFFIEAMATGTYISGSSGVDADPYVFYVDGPTALIGDPSVVATGNGLTQYQSSSTNQRMPRCWTAKNTASETWGTCCALGLIGNDTGGVKTGWPGNSGINPIAGTDDCLPIFWARPNANNVGATGFKGIGYSIHWKATARSTFTTMTFQSNRDFVIMRDVAMPWSGSGASLGSTTVPFP